MQKLICDEVVKSGILQSNLSTSKFLFYAPTLPTSSPTPHAPAAILIAIECKYMLLCAFFNS